MQVNFRLGQPLLQYCRPNCRNCYPCGVADSDCATYPARHRAILGHARDGLRSGHGNAGSKQDGPEQARKYHGGLSHVRAAAGSALDPT